MSKKVRRHARKRSEQLDAYPLGASGAEAPLAPLPDRDPTAHAEDEWTDASDDAEDTDASVDSAAICSVDPVDDPLGLESAGDPRSPRRTSGHPRAIRRRASVRSSTRAPIDDRGLAG